MITHMSYTVFKDIFSLIQFTKKVRHLLCGSSYFLNSFSVYYPISSQLHAFQMLLRRKKYLLSLFFVISYNSL